MSNSRYILLTVGVPLVMLVIGIVFFIGPNYHRVSGFKTEAADLLLKEDSLATQTVLVEELARQLEHTRRAQAERLKEIPPSADLASLIRRLSLPVDGRTVGDQTFTAGSEKAAIVGEETPFRVMPVTVEMRARFDSVFALIQAVESVRRLVRVASVRLSIDTNDSDSAGDFLQASVELEVVYETPGNSKG